MPTKTKVIIALGAVLVILIMAFGYSCGQTIAGRKAAKVLEQTYTASIKVLEAKDKDKDKEISKLSDDNEKLFDLIAKNNVALDKLAVGFQKEQETNKKLLAQVATTPPDQLVKETQRILVNKDLWLNGETVVFTMVPFRENMRRLLEWESFSLVQIPALQKTIVTQKSTIDDQAKVILNDAGIQKALGEKIGFGNEKYAALENAFGAYQKITTTSFLEKAGGFVYKVALGIVVGYAIASGK
jgi:secreted Zn-dependent insulinase-like peptidase